MIIKSNFFESESIPTATIQYLQTLKPLNECYLIPTEKQKHKLSSQNANLDISKYTFLKFLDEHIVLDFNREDKFFYKALYNKIDISKKTFDVKSDGYGFLVGVQRCIDDIDFALNCGVIYGNSTINAITQVDDVKFPCDNENFCATGIIKYYFTDRFFFYSLSGILYSRFKNDTKNLNDTFYVKTKSDLWYFSESIGLGYILKGDSADIGFGTAFKFDYVSSPSRAEQVKNTTIKYSGLDEKFLFYDVNCSLCLKKLPVLKNLSFIFCAELEVDKNISGQYAKINGKTENFTCYESQKKLFFAKILIDKKLSENSYISLCCCENWAVGVKNVTASSMLSFAF